MSSEITYRIFSLCQGWRECDASFLLYLSDIGRKAKLPYFFWLLVPNNGKSSPVLIDTGFMEGHYKNRYLDYNDYKKPVELLKNFDIRPSDIKNVIISHLHWDHFSANRIYASATFHIQKKEIDFWRGNFSDYHFLNHFLADLKDLKSLEENKQIKIVNGDLDIFDGISVHHVGGHSPGLQIIRVRTLKGWAVLAVDSAYVFRSFESMIPPGIHVHVDEALAALDKVKDLADSPKLIFPGHDSETLSIPEFASGVRQLV